MKKRERKNLLALTGAAALLAVAVNFAVAAINTHFKNLKKKVVSGSNVRPNLRASEILKLADHIIAKSKEVHDAVASVPLHKVTYANTILLLAELEAQQFPLIQSCSFPKLVSLSEDVRKASIEAERRIDAHILTCSKRQDVYRVVKAFAAQGVSASSEVKRLAQYLVQDFERNGLNLTSTKREELQRLRTQMDELSMRYIRNLNDDSTFLLFHDVELAGLPQDFIKNLDKTEDGKFKVVLKNHHISPIVELCKVGSTRKAVAVAYGRRCEVNLSVLEKLIQLRHKFARLLGYKNYAEYAVDIRMANSSTKVFEFLENISGSLTESASEELCLLKELKRKDEGESPFGIEDLPYYVKKVKEQRLELDFGIVKQYFPVDLVLSGIFKICQDLFGLRFEEVAERDVWHQDVQLFSVFDLSSGELLGYFYLDIYSRDGKYGHTCVVSLQNASWINNLKQIPVALLISQLPKEVDGHQGLLRFSEVVNLFHEFGHVVHHICNRAPFARFSGLRLDPDFVEIPSLVLENWCYESSSLKLISGFYQDITKPIEDEICKSLKRWRDSFSALKLKQEILYCLFDQIIHSSENVDMIGLFKHLHSKVMLGLPMLEGTNPASCFPRTVIGHEATCYSRIWGEVFAADIFSTKFHHDIFNQNVGMQFRNKVLTPGGVKDPLEILSDFLGREPSIQAFAMFTSKDAYWNAIGYGEKGGKIGSTHDYLERSRSYMKLYGALVQDLHGLKEGWEWLARFFNALPPNLYTTVALNSFLEMSGFALYRRCKDQFEKLMKVVAHFVSALKESGSDLLRILSHIAWVWFWISVNKEEFPLHLTRYFKWRMVGFNFYHGIRANPRRMLSSATYPRDDTEDNYRDIREVACGEYIIPHRLSMVLD